MGVIEIIVLAILGYALYKGYNKGFLHQLATILGLLIAYFFAGIISGKVHQYLIENQHLAESSSKWVSYIICFIGIIILVKILSKLIEKLLKFIGINFVNRFAGAILNAIKWFLILSVIVYFASDLELISIPSEGILVYCNQIGEELMKSFFNS